MLKKMVGEDEASTARSKVDLSRLESCRDLFFTHIQRSNYHLACYKCAASPMFERPKPFEDQGWKMSEEEYTEPLWSKGPVLPTTLVDVLDCADIDAEVEDIEETLLCYCYFYCDVYLVFLDLRLALFGGYKFIFSSLCYFLSLNLTSSNWGMQMIDLFKRIMPS